MGMRIDPIHRATQVVVIQTLLTNRLQMYFIRGIWDIPIENNLVTRKSILN